MSGSNKNVYISSIIKTVSQTFKKSKYENYSKQSYQDQ